jgi:hypothetical protein
LLFRDAWAWTPLKVWCGGDGYGWRRLGSVCKARPSVEPGRLKVVDGEVRGVKLSCPKAAVSACRGFVILRTTEPQYDPQSGARLPAELSRKDFNLLAGETADLRLPFDKTWKATLLNGLRSANPSVRVLLARDTLGERVMFDDQAEGVKRSLSIIRTKREKKKKRAPGDDSTTTQPSNPSDGPGPSNPKPDDNPQQEATPTPEPTPEPTPTPEPNPLVPPPSDDEITAPPAPTPTP